MSVCRELVFNQGHMVNRARHAAVAGRRLAERSPAGDVHAGSSVRSVSATCFVEVKKNDVCEECCLATYCTSLGVEFQKSARGSHVVASKGLHDNSKRSHPKQKRCKHETCF